MRVNNKFRYQHTLSFDQFIIQEQKELKFCIKVNSNIYQNCIVKNS